jgi:acyl-CoA thioester hydrolase
MDKQKMVTIQTRFRVTYSDTDQMGFMHHSSYMKYYENARWELFRSIGILYSEIEADGYILPVTEMSAYFIKPAFYDHDIYVVTGVSSLKGPRIVFVYTATNENGEIINKARVTVASVKKETGRACPLPKKILEKMNELM